MTVKHEEKLNKIKNPFNLWAWLISITITFGKFPPPDSDLDTHLDLGGNWDNKY